MNIKVKATILDSFISDWIIAHVNKFVEMSSSYILLSFARNFYITRKGVFCVEMLSKYPISEWLNRRWIPIYVLLRLRVQNAVPAQPCVGKYWISLILLNFLHCNFRLWFRTPQPFNSYPCHASEVTRNTLNHCLKFTVRSIFCHICYGKISKKNVNTFFKVKLLVSKTSDSCFQGFDLFQMLLASHS